MAERLFPTCEKQIQPKPLTWQIKQIPDQGSPTFIKMHFGDNKIKLVVDTLSILILLVSIHQIQGQKNEEASVGPHGVAENFKVRMNRGNISRYDPELINYVRTNIMISPSKDPYKVKQPKEINTSKGLTQQLDGILPDQGVFIECGAHDGEHNSNTLWLERNRGWTGLLIEPDPKTFRKLKRTNRKAFLANVCLSSKSVPEELRLYRHYKSELNSVIDHKRRNFSKRRSVPVQCIPLETLLIAAGFYNQSIDLFSLDVEGFELEIMKGFPFDKIPVKVFIIEHGHIPNGGFKKLDGLMTRNSYKLFKKDRLDSIYLHSSLNKV